MADREPGLGALPEDVTDDDASSAELEPSSSQSQDTPPTPEGEPNLRQIQAQHGRELASQRAATEAAQRALVAQTAQVQALNARLDQMGAYLTNRQKQERDAYLNSLPPERRQVEEVRLLRSQVEALEKRPPVAAAAPVHTESADEYTARRSRELVAAINAQHGLTGDHALTGEEDELDWDNEAAFIGSARTLAKIRSKGNGAMAQKNGLSGSGGSGNGAGAGGASRPLSPRPVGNGRKVDAATEANSVFTRNPGSRGGIKKRTAALDEIRQRARENVQRR